MPRTRGSLVAMCCSLLLAFSAGVVHAQAHFTARLDGNQELPPNAAPARGSGSFTLTSLGLQFFITVEGLSGPITGARIFDGPPGLPGVPVRDILAEFSGTNTAAGLWTPGGAMPLTPALIEQLMAGNLHVNLYTAAFPGGEVRGQIRLSAGTHFTANLRGLQVNPPLGVPGAGAGTFTLTEEGLHFKLTVDNLTGAVTGAHIHSGAVGVNGLPIVDILPFFSGNTAVGFVTGLTPAQRKELVAGSAYVDVHTVANPVGELRGQIALAGGIGFSAKMDGGQEVPPNAAPGLGTVVATLTASGLMLDFSADGLTGAITDAHVHRGPPGVAGPPVRTFSAAEFLSATTGSVLWRYDDPEPFTAAMMSELIAGNLYVNLHTPAFAGGEIRGQLTPNLPAGTAVANYVARLSGPQEEPPIPAPALGTGTFTLTAAGLSFRITVEGLSGAITGAHFHTGAIGVGGGAIVRGLVAAEFVGPGTMAGLWSPLDPMPLTPALVTELIKGDLYFNVHTAAAPGGEIRGQILPASGADLEARLTGAQETPPVGVVGVGTGSFTLTGHGLAFNITANGLTGALTGAHIHRGGPGVGPGPIVRGFTAGEFIAPNTFAGVWKPTDASPLTAALISDLMKGDLYVNFHTGANPGGEVRGQIVLAGGDARGARLLGAHEVPPVATPGQGTASMTLTDHGMVFRLSANDLLGPINNAHFHDGPPGVNGPAVRDILAEFSAQTGDGVWRPDDAMALTPALIRSLWNGNLYLNVHTVPNATGEVRGQIGQRSVTAVAPVPARGAPTVELTHSPNPLSGLGTMSFRLSKPGAVSLVLYDVAGAEIQRLVDGPREAGWHRVPIDVAQLKNGVYFYRLGVEGGAAGGRMLVLH